MRCGWVSAFLACLACGAPATTVYAEGHDATPHPSPSASWPNGEPVFIPHARLAAIKAAAQHGTPEWKALTKAVDAHLAEPGFGESGFMNVGVVYLGTGAQK